MVTAGFAALQCRPCLPHPPPLGRAPYLRGARGLALLPRESHVEDSCRGCGTYRGSVLHGGSEPVKDVEPQPRTTTSTGANLPACPSNIPVPRALQSSWALPWLPGSATQRPWGLSTRTPRSLSTRTPRSLWPPTTWPPPTRPPPAGPPPTGPPPPRASPPRDAGVPTSPPWLPSETP